MEKVNVTCRLEKKDVAFLDLLAGIIDCDRGHLINKAVAEYIALQRWQIGEIEKAIAEADAGDFAAANEVGNYLRSIPRLKVRWLSSAVRSLRKIRLRMDQDSAVAPQEAAFRIERAVRWLGEHPRSGRQGTVPGTRELVVPGSGYMLVYRLARPEVHVLAVFRTQRDDLNTHRITHFQKTMQVSCKPGMNAER
jgi:plasmid stabilization system protein ParE/predicted transcriptional regulator